MLQERSEVGGGGDDAIDSSASFADDELVLPQELWSEAGGGGTSPSLSLTGDNTVVPLRLVSSQEYSFSSSYSANDALLDIVVWVDGLCTNRERTCFSMNNDADIKRSDNAGDELRK